MNIVVGWILVGYVHWNSGGGSVPNYGVHATKASCEGMKADIEAVARHSGLRCSEVVLKAQEVPIMQEKKR